MMRKVAKQKNMMIKFIIFTVFLIGCDTHYDSSPLNIYWEDYTPGIKTEPATKICGDGIKTKTLIEKEYWAVKLDDCLIIKDGNKNAE